MGHMLETIYIPSASLYFVLLKIHTVNYRIYVAFTFLQFDTIKEATRKIKGFTVLEIYKSNLIIRLNIVFYF